jgi:hypothetical protein
VALAGSSTRFAVKKLGLPEGWFQTPGGHSTGIAGALSWQPTFLFDDQMWFAYAEAVKGQQLYRGFGSWRKAIGPVAEDSRSSIDRRFMRVQKTRLTQKRQQKGNRRTKAVEQRRPEMLEAARKLWSSVLVDRAVTRGRPNHRKKLEQLLGDQGLTFSRRDLDWVMQRLRKP